MRSLRLALILGALVAAVTAGDAPAATFCVNSPGCVGTAASSIADAATKSNAVNDGTTDVIKVGPGTYPNTSTIFVESNPVTIVGAGRNQTFIEGNANSIVLNFHGPATISALTVRLDGAGNNTGLDFRDTGTAENVTVTSALSHTNQFGIRLRRGGSLAHVATDLAVGHNNNIGVELTSLDAKGGGPAPAQLTDVHSNAPRAIVLGPGYGPVALRRVQAIGRLNGIEVRGPATLNAEQLLARATGGVPGGAYGLNVESQKDAAGPVNVALRHASVSTPVPGAALWVIQRSQHPVAIGVRDSLLLAGDHTSSSDLHLSSPSGAPATVALDRSAWRAGHVWPTALEPTIGEGNVDLDRSPANVLDLQGGDLRPGGGSVLVDNGTPGPLGASESALDLFNGSRLRDGDGDGVVARDIGAFEAPEGTNPGHVAPVLHGPPVPPENPPQPRPAPVDARPSSRVTKPPNRRSRVVAGTAKDDHGVKRVQLSITRVVKGKGKRRVCQSLTPKGTWVAGGRPRADTCAPRFRFVAKGTTRWKVTLRKPLPAGVYTATSRATDAAGQVQTALSARGFRIAARKR